MLTVERTVMPHSFTAHNITLDDGTLTIPGSPGLLKDAPLLQFARPFLRLLFPDGFKGRRLVDLGCLEGGYAVEFARAGFDTLGIEIRLDNFENCQLVKARTSLSNLRFACDDVRNVEQYGTFDVVFCCGILYHLDEPRKFLEKVARVCRRVLIVDTHVATEQSARSFGLSENTENEGLTGSWYSEVSEESQRHADKWASWDNPRSFWPEKPALHEAIRQTGFSIVFECPIPDPWRESAGRITLVGVKG
jgi:SAM-dependent methyltransferase